MGFVPGMTREAIVYGFLLHLEWRARLGCVSQLKLLLRCLMTDRGEAGRRSIVSGPSTFQPAATATHMPVHAGAALCCTAAPEADGDRGKESKEIKGLQGGLHV